MRSLCAAALVLALVSTVEGAEIKRVEPAFWWQGFQNTELQLMVYGDDIAALEPQVNARGIRVVRSVRTGNPNYLFVYLDIGPQAVPGRFTVEFSGGDEQLAHEYTLLAKNPDPDHAAGFSSKDSIYLITPDRFANGDASNDSLPGYADKLDRADPTGRHGGDIAGMLQRLTYIDDMGFTAIWLNPLLENAMPQVSYHGYSTTDFYRVDPRYGSNENYRELVAAARARGIGTIMDMIVNHIGSEHPWMHDLPARDWLNKPDSREITSHEHTVWQDPYAAESDKAAFADGWFVDSMPDLNQRNPLLADYLVQNALWWIEYLGLAGIRMDTYPYPDKEFMAEWTRRVMQEYPQFNIVGEEWSTNIPTVAYWQQGKQNHDGYRSWLPSLMDFPLQDALRRALVDDEVRHASGFINLYRTLANDFLYADPSALVVFPDNHDMSRIYTQLGEDYDLWRMAMVFTLTVRGTPQIYYGTEILMRNPGTDEHGVIRSDFPGGWRGDRANAFAGSGLSPEARAAQSFTRKLLRWRRNASVVHSGKFLHYVPRDHVYSYFRYNGNDRVMVVLNKAHTERTIAPERFAQGLDGHRHGRDVLTGASYSLDEPFTVPARGILLLELGD